MKQIALMLTAWLASACAAQQATTETVPMASVELTPAVVVEAPKDVESSDTEPAEEELTFERETPPPPMPTLTQEEFNDAFMGVASCYDFHIPSSAQKGFADRVKLVIYEPCLMAGIEQAVLKGAPIPQSATTSLSLAPVRPGIFEIRPGLTLELTPGRRDPQLCVTPDVVGGTFPESMRCSNLGHYVGSDRYSLAGLTGWYVLFREAAKDAQQNAP